MPLGVIQKKPMANPSFPLACYIHLLNYQTAHVLFRITLYPTWVQPHLVVSVPVASEQLRTTPNTRADSVCVLGADAIGVVSFPYGVPLDISNTCVLSFLCVVKLRLHSRQARRTQALEGGRGMHLGGTGVQGVHRPPCEKYPACLLCSHGPCIIRLEYAHIHPCLNHHRSPLCRYCQRGLLSSACCCVVGRVVWDAR